MRKPAVVLCVGGSDSGAGAGVQADLKAVAACGAYAVTAVTALTAQNTRGVQSVFPVPAKVIAAQIEAVVADIGVDAVKTGMLPSGASVAAVVEMISRHRLKNVVVDPVMIAKGGRRVMGENAQRLLVRKLLPLARVVTPNIPEAEALAGMKIRSVAAMKEAAARIARLGAQNVVVKGGHLPQSRRAGSVDVLYDGGAYREFRADWIDTPHTHGTGCTFASALAAGLAEGKSVACAVAQAKKIMTRAIRRSLVLGKGRGPVNVL